MKEVSNSIGLTPADREDTPIVRRRKNHAAGMTAVVVSLRHLFKYMKPSDILQGTLKINQKGGFDCSGCAWPDPDDERSGLGEYCENGMKALAEEAQKTVIGKDFFAGHSIHELQKLSDFELGKQGRLGEPLIVRKGQDHYSPIEWNEAFQLIAEELNALPDPDQALFYTSGRTSNEAAFLYQLLVRAYGTNNLPDCSNMCHESSGVALSETLGLGKGSVTLSDFYQSELVIVMGQNPGTNHPRMLSALERCKENGGKIVSVNPMPEAGLEKFINPQSPLKILKGGTKLSDLYLPVKINGDLALLKAVMLLLKQKDDKEPGTVFDMNFIRESTVGFDEFIADLQNYNLEELIRQAGVEQKKVEELADLVAQKKKIIICWAMGITQHENGVDTIREIVNLLLLRGAIGKTGAGTCPVRGHSNVQGDRTMGIWENPPESFLLKLDETYKMKSPRKHGYSVIQAIRAMHEGKAKVFFAMGGNFLSAAPDTIYTAEALQKCRLTVHVSTKLNRSHLVHGETAIILPCLTRSEKDMVNGVEQFISVENSMGIVHSSQGIFKPASENLMSEPLIVCSLARHLFPSASGIPWDLYASHYDNIRNDIEKVIPGFENYNVRVREEGGFYLPNGPRKGIFTNKEKRALFTKNKPLNLQKAEDELMMMTIRSHDQYNTTVYGLNDRYRGIKNGRRVILMNRNDMEKHGFVQGDKVNIMSRFNGKTRRAENFFVIPYEIAEGCAATYFPETNVLVPIDSFEKRSLTPASKMIRITLEKRSHSELS